MRIAFKETPSSTLACVWRNYNRLAGNYFSSAVAALELSGTAASGWGAAGGTASGGLSGACTVPAFIFSRKFLELSRGRAKLAL
jgi:hypothetical protein